MYSDNNLDREQDRFIKVMALIENTISTDSNQKVIELIDETLRNQFYFDADKFLLETNKDILNYLYDVRKLTSAQLQIVAALLLSKSNCIENIDLKVSLAFLRQAEYLFDFVKDKLTITLNDINEQKIELIKLKLSSIK